MTLALAALGGEAAIARDASRLPDAVRHAERNGQVLKAEEMRRGDQQVPRVKVLTPDGRVRVLRDAPPPATAAVRPVPRTGERALPVRPSARRDDAPVRDDGYGRED